MCWILISIKVLLALLIDYISTINGFGKISSCFKNSRLKESLNPIIKDSNNVVSDKKNKDNERNNLVLGFQMVQIYLLNFLMKLMFRF